MSFRVTKVDENELVVGLGNNPTFDASRVVFGPITSFTTGRGTDDERENVSIKIDYLYDVDNDRKVLAPLSFYTSFTHLDIHSDKLNIHLDWTKDENLIEAHKLLYKAFLRYIGANMVALNKFSFLRYDMRNNPKYFTKEKEHKGFNLLSPWSGCVSPIKIFGDDGVVDKTRNPVLTAKIIEHDQLRDAYKTIFVTPTERKNKFGSYLDYHHDLQTLRGCEITGSACITYDQWCSVDYERMYTQRELSKFVSSVIISDVQLPGGVMKPFSLLERERERRRGLRCMSEIMEEIIATLSVEEAEEKVVEKSSSSSDYPF